MFSRNIVILNWKTVIFFLLIIFLNGVIHSEIDNETVVNYSTTEIMEELEKENIEDSCSTSNFCTQLQYPCIHCKLDNISCIYGSDILVECLALDGVNCEGIREFNLTMKCRYCYQANSWEYKCVKKFSCKSVSSPREYYRTNCTVNNDVICLGKRRFLKRELCNWTDGYKWSTTLILSITLGGFGADRFYLGHWQEGIGKLFSFGGLGVWTLIDVLLISLHYLGPADGSLYI